MRNLKVLVVDVEYNESITGCGAFCVNTNNDNVYFIKNECVTIYEFHHHSKPTRTLVPLDQPFEGEVISAEYVCELNALCVGTSSGDLTTLAETSHELECVGSVSGGLKAMSWSPDQDLLVLITGDDNLMLMTRDFDPLSEKYLHPDEFGENKPVTAGWGTKETQFHGSEGKEKRNVKQVVEPVSAADDRTPVITWRGDGQMFAVSTVHPQTSIRQIRIWDRECLLLCTSEDVNGLGGSVSWRPSGSVIAGVQQLLETHQIVFFEKNGLRHREFPLPFQKTDFEVKGLSWNSDSSILAVYGRNPVNEKPDAEIGWKVMLWTTSNYHWFLKLTFDLGDKKVSCLQWDVMDPYVLRLCSGKTGLFVKYTLCWNTDRSLYMADSNKEDSSLVAVNDGNRVNVTPFGRVVIPPPLCAYSFILPTFANQVIFAPPSKSSDVIVALTDNRLARFTVGQDDVLTNEGADNDSNAKQECSVKLGVVGANGGRILLQPHSFKELYTITWDQQLNTLDVPCSAHHWLWVSEERLACLIPNNSSGDALFSVNLTEKSNSGSLFGRFCCDFDLHGYAVCLAGNESVGVQLTDGSVFVYNFVTNSLSPWELQANVKLKVPQPTPYIHVCRIGSRKHLLSLSRRNRFFVDDRELLNNCTSFCIHKDFLLLTTHSHTLRCLHLQHDLPKLLAGQQMASVDESPRMLERGSRLVTSVSSETRVVLQMPRGNLEAIHPRTLLLHTISNLLDRLNYKAAFQLMRKHRINLNLLHDHNPKAFMENTEVFVRDVDNPDHINLFLSELMEGDVTRTMYSSAYRYANRTIVHEERNTSKVDDICDKLKAALLNVDEKRFFLSVITTYAKKTTPELEVALQKIKELQSQEESSVALDHLLYMVDVNHLYDIALGTYNFDMVLMVAEKSQKDPKEFLQFLNSLKTLEPNYQRYKIDMHLRRYKKALTHIASCGESHFEEFVHLIQSQKLHRDALHIFPAGSSQNKRVWQLYGEYLLSKRQLEEAGLAFQRSGHWESALSAHQGALLWEMALYDALQLGYGPVQMSQLAKNLAEGLKLNGRHLEAADLLEEYAQDEEECIATLVEGQLWSAALLRIGKYKRPDLLETHLKPGLRESASELSSTLAQISQDFSRHLQRLQTVRENKQRSEMDLPDEDDVYVDPHGDAFSETSSITGTSYASVSNTVLSGSIATRRSNRSRQKKELKKYSLKEGSRFEDLALISALSELVSSANGLRVGCSALLKSLVFFGFDQEASLLQRKTETLFNTIESSLKIVWPSEDVSSDKPVIELGPAATSNLIAASMKEQRLNRPLISDAALRIPPQFKKDSDWKLFLLEK